MARNRTSQNEIAPKCPIHKLVYKQTFSIEEMEQFLAQQETFQICKDCAYFFQKEINKRIEQDRDARY